MCVCVGCAGLCLGGVFVVAFFLISIRGLPLMPFFWEGLVALPLSPSLSLAWGLVLLFRGGVDLLGVVWCCSLGRGVLLVDGLGSVVIASLSGG